MYTPVNATVIKHKNSKLFD